MSKSWLRFSNLGKLALLLLLLIWVISVGKKNKIPGAKAKSAMNGSIEQVVLRDALNNRTLGTRTGGRFAFSGGWQVTGVEDMIVYDLGRYIENGSLELKVRNFWPYVQSTYYRHHFLSLFRTPWGNHHPVENQETLWDLHAGSYYSGGVKLLSWTYDHAESSTVIPAEWSRKKTYRLKLSWNGKQLQYFRNGVLQAAHTHSAPMQMRYLLLGRDFTVGANMVTNFKNNQYPALVGPIYSNLVVKEYLDHVETVLPQITRIAASGQFANAARLSWETNEPAVCYVEYGVATDYGQRTPVLGTPAQIFSTALADLEPNRTYHYRIVALDEAGNRATSADQIFTTLAEGRYLFKPLADTYVETSGLYGDTRQHGNYGWMNLLGGAGRECYLRFNVSGLQGDIMEAALRLHGRQSGNGGAAVHALHASWNENATTWLNKPEVGGPAFGAINNAQAGRWHEVAVTAALVGEGWHDFALLGAGAELVSFDSRESANSQPELIVTTGRADRLSGRLTSF